MAQAKYTSCPVLNSEGNYEIYSDPTKYTASAVAQNACGLETLRSDADTTTPADANTLLTFSPFKNILAKPLSAQTIIEPTLVRDACLRRAGSTCHTDLDCYPNKMHAEQVENFPVHYFGNEAEQNFHREYLVCGQGDPAPIYEDVEAYKNYDMGKNTCCREIGKDLTTYTQAAGPDPDTDPSAYLLTDYLPFSANNHLPNQPSRYSRFITVDGLNSTDPAYYKSATFKYSVFRNETNDAPSYGKPDFSTTDVNATDSWKQPTASEKHRPILSAKTRDEDQVPKGLSPFENAYNHILKPYQWKTLNEANSETCCGGGWVRKFADGTTDWTRRNRLVIDVTNFRCINSMTPLLTNPQKLVDNKYYSDISKLLGFLDNDLANYCIDPTGATGGCAQFEIPYSLEEKIPTSNPFPLEVVINTLSPIYVSDDADNIGQSDFYFLPESGDSNSEIVADYSESPDSTRRNIVLKIPSYVPDKSFELFQDDQLAVNKVHWINERISLVSGSAKYTCYQHSNTDNIKSHSEYDDVAVQTSNFCPPLDINEDELGFDFNKDGVIGQGGDDDSYPYEPPCCYFYNRETRILKVIKNNEFTDDDGGINSDVGVEIRFSPAGAEVPKSRPYTTSDPISPAEPGYKPVMQEITKVNRTTPGSSTYYLKILQNLELIGIPQIYYEPLYCNDDSDRLVPGIFKDGHVPERPSFTAPALGQTRAQVEDVDNLNIFYNYYQTNSPNNPDWLSTHHNLSHDKIFSAHEFKCCANLGKVVDVSTKCCSGYAVQQDQNSIALTCMLPPGTNLMVYFNRYVSNDGMATEDSSGGLVEDDFDRNTGYPNYNEDVLGKVRALGEDYCNSRGQPKVRVGGAFGSFPPENLDSPPMNLYGIVDSYVDVGQISEGGTTYYVGFPDFAYYGFRWNNHLYCND